MPAFRDRYDLFVFDLDGTLADTREDLAASLNHALGVLGRSPLSLETITRCVGNGARVLLERALGPSAPGEALERGLAAFLEHYQANCVRATRLCPGAAAVLEALRGKALAVLTNKPLAPTLRILGTLGIEPLFARVLAGDSLSSKKPDPAGLLSILATTGAARARTLLVGDSDVDVETARAAGVAAALVPHGYQLDAGRAAPPDHWLLSLEDLLGEIPLENRPATL